jgi:hypothetical protein
MREHMSLNRLAILPGVTHYDIFLAPAGDDRSAFSDGKSGATSWDEQVR